MKQKRKRMMALALCLMLLACQWMASGATAARSQAFQYASGTISGVAYNSALAGEVVRQVNAERARRSLRRLAVSAELTRAARVRAIEIVRRFSHTRPDGTPWRTVSSAVYGENIAMGQRTADKVMAAWMTSSGHRANILRASYGSIGVCSLVSGGITYWVQLFGK